MSVLLSPTSPFLLVLALFLVSLLIVLSAAAWFTRRLEALCDRLDLSAGMLSILSALGANIPNYVASIVAIANGQQDVGLGIIIGSNIYNLAIILGISALAAPGSHGIHLRLKEKHDVLIIAYYAFAITLTTLVAIWLLPRTPIVVPVSIAIIDSRTPHSRADFDSSNIWLIGASYSPKASPSSYRVHSQTRRSPNLKLHLSRFSV